MLKVDTTCFIRDPKKSDKRILCPAKVIAADINVYTLKPEGEPQVTLEQEQMAQIFFEQHREFMQQEGQVIEVGLDEAAGTIKVKMIGKPVSAEQRQCYRVSAVMSDLKATFGKQENCPLLDVSVTGFAIISSEKHQIGEIISVTLFHEGKEFTGSASIKSVLALRLGRFRYGMHGIEDPKVSGTLGRGMNVISMAIQREQLRRMAGAQA